MCVKTNLTELRAKRGLGAAQLARRVGVSRQTVYAIEAGNYVPNTAVSLKLARALDATVEELFHLDTEERAAKQAVSVTILGNTESIKPGQPLNLCNVDGNTVAVAPEIGAWGIPPADAVLLEPVRKGKHAATAKVQVLGNKWKGAARILLAGCDPSVSILAQSLQAQGCELIVGYENSSRSLELLRGGLIHVAGSHLMDKTTGKTDFLPITSLFVRNTVAVFSYAIWEEGLVIAQGNPKRIAGVEDLTRKGIRFTNREQGAGCRRLWDDLLHKKRILAQQIDGYDRITAGHLASARLVREGEVDCCVSTRVVARAMSLDFIPLAEKPYQLVFRRAHLNLSPIQTLIETLSRASFRREVEAFTGYDMGSAGDRLI